MEEGTVNKSALNGITVVDFTQFESGSTYTLLLAWLGADVIKIEKPGGDPGRETWEGFAPLNCNKRSIVINLKRPEGSGLVRRLIRLRPNRVFVLVFFLWYGYCWKTRMEKTTFSPRTVLTLFRTLARYLAGIREFRSRPRAARAGADEI